MTQLQSMSLSWTDLDHQERSMHQTLQVNHSTSTGLHPLTLEDLPSPTTSLKKLKLEAATPRLAATSPPATPGLGTLLLEPTTTSRSMLRISMVSLILLLLMSLSRPNIHLIP